MTVNNQTLKNHHTKLKQCKQCPNMLGKPVIGHPVMSKILLIGQAPGHKELDIHKPFAWTAGKTLFKWFSLIGLDEEDFRQHVYISAVCRCFPGKKPKGGDRVPDKDEICNCSNWINSEIEILKPELILPVGKLAISQFLDFKKLTEVIGIKHQININNQLIDMIPLPHPSGASTWHQSDPGKTLLAQSLELIKEHSAWTSIM
jgi:uracil-DNA glycosylase